MASQKVPDLSRVEMAVLATLVSKERYGLEIRDTLKDLGQSLSLAGLYTTLPRLEKLGLVTSRWGDEKVEVRQGARRRYYEITGAGVKAIKETKAVVKRVLHAVPNLARAEAMA
jgi:DNA-binding PadR family transcriptional regulator